MCGIFGIIAKEDKYKKEYLIKVLEDLAKLSQVRGTDSSGIAFRFESVKKIEVLKGPESIHRLLKTKNYELLKKQILDEKEETSNKIFTALGHARLVTNGSQLQEENNQPVIKDGIIGIHNGIIANDAELWEKHNHLIRNYEIDTEFYFAYVRDLLNKNSKKSISPAEACFTANSEVIGTVSIAYLDTQSDNFTIFSNFGSLYILSDFETLMVFGSEKNILLQLLKKHKFLDDTKYKLNQVVPLSGYVINLNSFKIFPFDSKNFNDQSLILNGKCDYNINVTSIQPDRKQLHAVLDPKKFSIGIQTEKEKNILEYNIERISKLKRCTKCILPETFPFIEFDENGVCNICNNYVKKNQFKPIEEIENIIEPYRRNDGNTDCLVPFSGGRDSTYTLHIVKNILKMNPIAFTYDWGMVTDLGRRNIARVTGKLGVENIIVAGDIKRKRNNIKKNVTAWLKNPKLGLVPLFMAGDKYFFYYSNRIIRQNNLKLSIWGSNPLENTDFKTGFCGVKLNYTKKRIDTVKFSDKLKMTNFFAKSFIENPHYLNSSLLDTIGAFSSRYIIKRQGYIQLFDFIQWSEKEINTLLTDEYKWEKAIDTNTTWRIGDGTAGFYNYIFYTVAGFSEYDTFRSNQIREGMLDRDKALQLVFEENYPRYESIKWYLEIIGLNFDDVIKRINSIPKLY